MSAASNLDLDLQRMKLGPETPDPLHYKQEPTAALYMQRKSPVKATEFALQPSFFLQYPTMTPLHILPSVRHPPEVVNIPEVGI